MSYVVKLNNITEETIDNFVLRLRLGIYMKSKIIVTIKTKLLNVSTAHNRL